MAGFYGRLTNESKTSMTFDRVYPNRVTMDAHADDDGVFNGRFVLVEYTLELTEDSIVKNYLDDKESGTGSEYSALCAEAAEEVVDTELDKDQFYYNYNYSVDKILYKKLGRGNDSTVWRKVVTSDDQGNTSSQYVMLAELNSVVPSFDATALAPSDDPVKPTFSKDSSNIYYNLELGSLWGFDLDNVKINAAGFDPNTRHIDGTPIESQGITWSEDVSGKEYRYYDDQGNLHHGMANDIKVLNINLPIIGDMVATGWDAIYGKDRNTSPVNWHDGKYWQEYNGPQLVENGEYHWGEALNGSSLPIGNIADAIRSTYDLAGMIIQPITYQDFKNITVDIPDPIMEPGYIYYIYDEMPTGDDLTEDQEELKSLIENSGRFYYLGYKYGFSDDYFVSENAEGFVEGQKATEVKNTILALPEDTSYWMISEEEDENHRPLLADYRKAEIAEAGKNYYQLDTMIFDGKEAIDYSNSNADALIEDKKIFKRLSSEQGTITLTQVMNKAELNDSNYIYYILNPQEFNDDHTYQAAIFRSQTTLGTNIFYDSQGEPYDYEKFANAEDGTVLYYKTSNDPIEIVDPITGRTEYKYETTFKPICVKSASLITCAFGQVGSEAIRPPIAITDKKICAWPSNNANWDPTDENFAQTANQHYWIKKEENGVITLILQDAPLPLGKDYSEPNGEEGKPTANAILGSALCGDGSPNPGPGGYGDQDERIGGHDDLRSIPTNIKGLCAITNVEIENIFPEPGTTYWVCNDQQEKRHIYYIDENTNIPEEDINHIYDLESDSIDLRVGQPPTPIAGIIGSNMYDDENDNTQYYFVPNELYVYDANTQTYTKAEEFDSNATYYTLSRTCVKYDFTDPEHPFSKFRESETWNPNLNLDAINRQKVSVNTIVNSGFELEFNENIPYYDANGTAIAQPREEDFLSYYIDPVVVSYETKNLAFFPMERYAENLNTVNGMIVMLNRLMGDSNDKTTRDISTVQGMLNTLEDKLGKLENIPGDSLVVTDQYGHLNGATQTAENGLEEERAIITHPIDENNENNIPSFGADHYDAATGSYGPSITISNMPNSWITADVQTGTDGNVYAYILHNTVTASTLTTTITDMNDPVEIATITINELLRDDAGHVIGERPHRYDLPYGFKYASITNSDSVVPTVTTFTLSAENPFETLQFSSQNKWIKLGMMNSNSAIGIGHAITTTEPISAGDTSSRTPIFGQSFNTTAITVDEAGHITTLSAYPVTIPAITFSDASTSTDGYTAITGLSFDPSSGEIIVERDPIAEATLFGYETTTSTSTNVNTTITATMPIVEAISLLEYRIAEGLSALTATLTFTSADNILSLGLKQTDGLINDLTGGIDLISLATTTIGAAGEGGEPDTYVLTTTHKDIAGAINELKDRIDGIAATTFTPEGYVKILRTTSTAPVSSTSANIAALQNASTNSKYCASYSGLNTIATGWLWWIANTGSIYFCTSTGTDGSTTSWELLNSWR